MSENIKEPSIQQRVMELESAGWVAIRSDLWKAPEGGYFLGPYGAWSAMKRSQSAKAIEWERSEDDVRVVKAIESERSRARAGADPHPEDAQRQFPVLIAAALVLRDGKVLLERRAPTGVVGLDGMWDLPGGKVECGESPAQAVVREIQEELGVNVVIARLLPTLRRSVWTYADATRHWILAAYECRLAAGQEPVLHERLQWFPLDDLPCTQILTADLEFIEECTAARADADKRVAEVLEAYSKRPTREEYDKLRADVAELVDAMRVTKSRVLDQLDSPCVLYEGKSCAQTSEHAFCWCHDTASAIKLVDAALAKHSEAPKVS